MLRALAYVLAFIAVIWVITDVSVRFLDWILNRPFSGRDSGSEIGSDKSLVDTLDDCPVCLRADNYSKSVVDNVQYSKERYRGDVWL